MREVSLLKTCSPKNYYQWWQQCQPSQQQCIRLSFIVAVVVAVAVQSSNIWFNAVCVCLCVGV